MKAIDTIYNGYKFRSRLEARWAVFFDSVKLSYIYEKEGFILNGLKYLPDFWIEDWQCWIEIKPNPPNLSESNVKEYELCHRMAKYLNQNVLLIGGNPWSKDESIQSYQIHTREYDIALFTNANLIQTSFNFKNKLFQKGIINIQNNGFKCLLELDYYTDERYLYSVIENINNIYPNLLQKIPKKGDINEMIEADKAYYRRKFSMENPHWIYGISLSNLGFQFEENQLYLNYMPKQLKPSNELIQAFTKARQVRF